MKYTVLFTDTAKNDLHDLAVYIAEESADKEIAKTFVRELAKCCDALADFPQMGAVPKDRVLTGMGYRFLVYKDYLIFYSAEQESRTVYIQAVFHAKKDYTRVFKNL